MDYQKNLRQNVFEELPHFLRKTKAYLILVSVLCSEMAGRAALLPISPTWRSPDMFVRDRQSTAECHFTAEQ
jgi:hypothetical protein